MFFSNDIIFCVVKFRNTLPDDPFYNLTGDVNVGGSRTSYLQLLGNSGGGHTLRKVRWLTFASDALKKYYAWLIT